MLQECLSIVLDDHNRALSPIEGLSRCNRGNSPCARKMPRTAIMRRRVKEGVEMLIRKCKSQGEEITELAVRKRVYVCVYLRERVCVYLCEI